MGAAAMEAEGVVEGAVCLEVLVGAEEGERRAQGAEGAAAASSHTSRRSRASTLS